MASFGLGGHCPIHSPMGGKALRGRGDTGLSAYMVPFTGGTGGFRLRALRGWCPATRHHLYPARGSSNCGGPGGHSPNLGLINFSSRPGSLRSPRKGVSSYGVRERKEKNQEKPNVYFFHSLHRALPGVAGIRPEHWGIRKGAQCLPWCPLNNRY